MRLHRPVGSQHDFFAIGAWKNWGQVIQPPHNNVATSNSEKTRLAERRNISRLLVYGCNATSTELFASAHLLAASFAIASCMEANCSAFFDALVR